MTAVDGAFWMLSLYHPAADDAVDWSRGNYAVLTRTGRVESDARWGETKRPTRMIAEGSVVMASAEPRGSITDVAPEGFPHPVYRAGFALAIPIPLRPVAKEAPVEPLKGPLLPELAPPLSEEVVAEDPLTEEPAA